MWVKGINTCKTRRTAPGVFERFINARSVTTIINLILLTAQRRHSGVILWVWRVTCVGFMQQSTRIWFWNHFLQCPTLDQNIWLLSMFLWNGVARAVGTKYHEPGGSEQQKCLRKFRIEAWAGPRAPPEGPLPAFPAPNGSWHPAEVLGCGTITPVPRCPFLNSPLLQGLRSSD